MVGQIGDLACAGCGDSGFDWRVWLFTRLDAVEEILHVGDGAVAEAVCPQDRVVFARHAFAMDAKAEAVKLQGCFGAAEFEAAVIDRGGHRALVNDIEAGIAHRCLKGVGAIPVLEDIFVSEDLRAFGLVGFHGPVHDVDPVGEQIDHGATAKVPKPAPEIEFFLVAERLIWSGAEPLLPIEGLGVDGLVRRECEVVLPPIGPDLRYAAEATALDEIHGIAKVAPVALLHATLQDLLPERTAWVRVAASSMV